MSLDRTYLDKTLLYSSSVFESDTLDKRSSLDKRFAFVTARNTKLIDLTVF